MALIYPGIECAICDQVISDEMLESEDFVATSDFIDDSAHALWRFSDAAMHRACFLNWEHRREFVQLYNDTMRPSVRFPGTHDQMNGDGDIIRVKN